MDEFYGMGGSYTLDANSGQIKLVHRTDESPEIQVAETAQPDYTIENENGEGVNDAATN